VPELGIEPALIVTTETTLLPGPVQVPDGVRGLDRARWD